jgi:SnoaL-like domain
MTATATDVTQMIDRYIETWNETDPRRRRELIAGIWAEEGSYVDPLINGSGHDGIDAMLAAVQAQFPDYCLRRTSEVDAHHDRVRFAWELGPEEGLPLAGGVDFGVLAGDRLQAITGFLDFAPGMGGQ